MDDVAEEAQAFLIIGVEYHRAAPGVRRRMLRRAGDAPRARSWWWPTRAAIEHERVRHPAPAAASPERTSRCMNGLMHLILENGWEDRDFIAAALRGLRRRSRRWWRAIRPSAWPRSPASPRPIARGGARLLATVEADGGGLGDGHHPAHHRRAQRAGPRQPADAARQHGRAGRRRQPAARPEQRAGRLRHGRAAGRAAPVTRACTDAAARARFAQPGVATPEDGRGLTRAWSKTGPDRDRDDPAGRRAARCAALYIVGEDPVLHRRGLATTCAAALGRLRNSWYCRRSFRRRRPSTRTCCCPGASFAEKDGTFTNTERRMQLVRQAIEPLGEARPDWAITADLARAPVGRWKTDLPAGPHAGWSLCAHLPQSWTKSPL